MSRFLNPQWLQSWHLSKVQQKSHSLIISLAVRTRSNCERVRQLKFKLLSFPERVQFHYKFFSFFFISCFPHVLAWILQAAHERVLQTSHQPYYCLLSLIMALIPSRWINIFILSLLKPEGSSALESKKGRKKERKIWRVEEGAQEKDDRWKGGSMLKLTNSKVTKPRQDFLVLSIICLIYFPLDTIITVLLIIFFSP